MRVRLRDDPTPEELAVMYAEPHDHRGYGYGHGLRAEATISLGVTVVAEGARSIADLSAGAAFIPTMIAARALDEHRINVALHLGDIAAGPGLRYRGPIEETLPALPEVDLFICSETIEHLPDPDRLLHDLYPKARHLLLSTPIGETDQGNPEHLWGWDQDGVFEMLDAAGWDARGARRIDLILPDTYSYQVWSVSR